MRGKQFLDTARLLATHGADEADFRSAVSRAYYACYWEIREVLFRSCDQEAKNKASIKSVEKIGHKPMLDYLNKSKDISIINLYTNIDTLQRDRNTADYKIKVTPLEKQDAEDSIFLAARILESLDRIPAKSIGSAMSDYINGVFKG
ncbi:MAG: HEPN domain-containing protein [Planctomycetes bacterium]|nr:HEPN domain-containing protein [Planctomycetota bacterium]